MNRRQIERFFSVLAVSLESEATAILTGAAAGVLWGRVRASRDVDFAITAARRDAATWDRLDQAVKRAVAATGLTANYAEDIDRWGLITLMDYREKARVYKKFGPLTLKLMDPAHWTIGKMTRGLELDIQDVVDVLKRRRVSDRRLTALWGRALRASPRSTALFQFRARAERFLLSRGRMIWGSPFDPEAAVRRFRREAGIAPSARNDPRSD